MEARLQELSRKKSDGAAAFAIGETIDGLDVVRVRETRYTPAGNPLSPIGEVHYFARCRPVSSETNDADAALDAAGL